MTAPSNSSDKGRGRKTLAAAVTAGAVAALTAAVVLNEHHPSVASATKADMVASPRSATTDRKGPADGRDDPSLPAAAGALGRDPGDSGELAPTF
jgi:hypothetical protein